VVAKLKNLKANIFVMDMCRIPQRKDLMLQALDEDDNLMLNPNPNPISRKGRSREIGKHNVNKVLSNNKPRSFVPPFLLTFEIYNRNLHNCLVDSCAS